MQDKSETKTIDLFNDKGDATKKQIECWGREWVAEGVRFFWLIRDLMQEKYRSEAVLDKLKKARKHFDKDSEMGLRRNKKRELTAYDNVLQEKGVYNNAGLALALLTKLCSKAKTGPVNDYALDILLCYLTMGPGLIPLEPRAMEIKKRQMEAWKDLGMAQEDIERKLADREEAAWAELAPYMSEPEFAQIKKVHASKNKISWAILSNFMNEQGIDKLYKTKRAPKTTTPEEQKKQKRRPRGALKDRFDDILRLYRENPEAYNFMMLSTGAFAWIKGPVQYRDQMSMPTVVLAVNDIPLDERKAAPWLNLDDQDKKTAERVRGELIKRWINPHIVMFFFNKIAKK